MAEIEKKVEEEDAGMETTDDHYFDAGLYQEYEVEKILPVPASPTHSPSPPRIGDTNLADGSALLQKWLAQGIEHVAEMLEEFTEADKASAVDAGGAGICTAALWNTGSRCVYFLKLLHLAAETDKFAILPVLGSPADRLVKALLDPKKSMEKLRGSFRDVMVAKKTQSEDERRRTWTESA